MDYHLGHHRDHNVNKYQLLLDVRADRNQEDAQVRRLRTRHVDVYRVSYTEHVHIFLPARRDSVQLQHGYHRYHRATQPLQGRATAERHYDNVTTTEPTAPHRDANMYLSVVATLIRAVRHHQLVHSQRVHLRPNDKLPVDVRQSRHQLLHLLSDREEVPFRAETDVWLSSVLDEENSHPTSRHCLAAEKGRHVENVMPVS